MRRSRRPRTVSISASDTRSTARSLKCLAGRQRRRASRRSPPIALAATLILAALLLPERALGNACTWTGATSTDWATAGNWSGCGGTTPQSGDTATVPSVVNDPVLAGSATISGLTISASGVVTVNGTLTMTNFTNNAGTLQGSGTSTVTGSATFNGGLIGAAGAFALSSSATGTISSTYTTVRGNFNNAGDITISGSGYFYLDQATSVFTNQTAGTVDIQHNTYAFYGVAGATLTNSGTMTRTTGSGAATIYNLTFTNTSPGTVSVTAGELHFSTTGSSTSTGSFSTAGTLVFENTATSNISGAITGGGTVLFNGQTVTLTGAYTATNTTISSGTVNFNQASTVTLTNLTMTGGTLAGSAAVHISTLLHVTSGTMTGIGATTLSNGATGTFDSSYLTLTRSFVNAALLTLSNNAYIYIPSSGGSFTNQTTGTVDIQHNTYAFYGGAAGLPVTNTGSITRTTSSGAATIYNVVLTNTSPGTISVSTGELHLQNSGSSTNTGSFSSTAVLVFEGSATNTISGAVTGGGTVNFGGSQTTTLTGTYTVANTTISSGTVNFNQASAVNLPNLTLSGSGTLAGSAAVNVTTSLHVLNGTMTGIGTTTLANGATGTFDSGNLALTRPFVVAGALTMSNSGYFQMNSGGSVTNQSTGSIEIQQDNYAFYGLAAGLPLNNTGSITRTTGSGTATIYNVVLTNTSPGTVSAQSGTLDLQTSGSSTSTGSFSSSGGTLQFSGSATRTISGAITGGTVIFAGSSTTTLTGTYTATNTTISSGTVNFNQASAVTLANLTLSGSGTLAGSAAINVTTLLHATNGTMTGTGTMTLANGGTGTFDGSSVTLTRPLVNAGAMTFSSSGYLALNSGGSVNNQSTGSIEIQHDTYAIYASAIGLNLTNTGSITRTTGSGTAIIYNVVLTNTSPGTVSAQSGTLDLQTSGTSTSTGSFSSSGGTLQFSGTATRTISGPITGGTVNFAGSAINTLTGTYTATNTTISSGTVNFNQASAVTLTNLTLNGGTLAGSANINVPTLLHVNGGTMTGTGTTTLQNLGTGTFDGSPMTLTRPFVNNGAITQTVNGYFSMNTGGSLTNSATGTIEIRLDTYAIYSAAAGLPVSNAGSVTRTTGSLTAYIYNVAFTNTGIVECQSGTLQLFNYTQTAGQTILSGGDFSTAGTTWNINGGTLKGTGTITGNVSNAATVAPGLSPGILTITGNYTQTSAGTLAIEQNGATPGTGYDQLVVSGTVTLAGTLSINTGFTPTVTTSFTIISNGGTDAVSGNFTGIPEGTVVVTPAGNYRVSYKGDDGNDVTMTFLTKTAYHTVQPCRVADTRTTAPPALIGGQSRAFTIAGNCGIPGTAQAVAFNFTIVGPTNAGDLRIYPGGAALPLVSTINYRAGQTRANNAIVLLGPAGDINIRVDGSGTVNAVIDVFGYFE